MTTISYLLATVVILIAVFGSIAQESADKTEVVREIKVSGTFAPAGPPVKKPVRIEAGESCIVDLIQSYTISGSLSGSIRIDYRIFVAGPCGEPAGTYDEEWIAHGMFTGSVNATAATANLSYTAKVEKGGDVDGQILFGEGLDGELQVTGNFGDGKLSYNGVLK